MGGSRNPAINSVANLLLLCGSGTTGCHGHVESHRAEAVEQGFIVPRPASPESCPVFYRLEQWVLLTPDGRVEPWEPAVESSS